MYLNPSLFCSLERFLQWCDIRISSKLEDINTAMNVCNRYDSDFSKVILPHKFVKYKL